VRIDKQVPHRGLDLRLVDRNNSRNALQNDFEGLRVRSATRHAVGQRWGDRMRYETLGGKRLEIARRRGSRYADDFGSQPQRFAGCDGAADSGA
jgi:hypothetical protein